MAVQVGWPCWMTVAFLLCGVSTVESQQLLSRPKIVLVGLAIVNHSVTLYCRHFDVRTAHHEVTYTWYKGDVFIRRQTSPSLRIPSVTRKDKGTYKCRVSNGNPRITSRESRPFSIHVLFSPEVHIETSTDKPVIKAVLGESLTLTCVVTAAYPPVQPDGFSWSYSSLPEGPRRPLAGKESTLTLGPLTREDSGQYFCQAWNDFQFKGKIPPGNASVTVDVVSRFYLLRELTAAEGVIHRKTSAPVTFKNRNEGSSDGTSCGKGCVAGSAIAATLSVLIAVLFLYSCRHRIRDKLENADKACYGEEPIPVPTLPSEEQYSLLHEQQRTSVPPEASAETATSEDGATHCSGNRTNNARQYCERDYVICI